MRRSSLEFRSISTQMLRRIVALALALVCLLGIGGTQLWQEQRLQERQFASTMALIVETGSRAIGHALWDIDRALLHSHVQRLADMDAVGAVRARVSLTGEELMAGSHPDSLASAPSWQAVIYAPNDAGQVLGGLEIWADPDYRRDLLWESQKHVITGYLIFTTLMCITVAWVIRRDLGLPLRQIADFVRHLRPESLSQPLQIQRPHRARIDEMDLVVQGFHDLQMALEHHIRELDSLVDERTKELAALVDEVERMSQQDVLTGAYNRRAMELRLPQEMGRSLHEGRALSVIFVDIDHFKRINDEHGHLVGDAVLQTVAHRLQAGVRSSLDWVVRFGGEEFIVFLPGAGLEQASALAQRLAEAVRSTPWQDGGLSLSLSCSFGVTQCRPDDSMDSLLQRVDGLLYQAKEQGRDQVCTAA